MIYIPRSALGEFLKLPEWMRPLVYYLLVMPHYNNGNNHEPCVYFTTTNIQKWTGRNSNESPSAMLKTIEKETGIKAHKVPNEKCTLVDSVDLPDNWAGVREELLQCMVSLEDRYDLYGRRYRAVKQPEPVIGPSKYCERINSLVAYLNVRRNFHAQGRRIAKDLKAIVKELKADGQITARSESIQLSALELMMSYPQPFYQPVDKSARIYPMGRSAIQLKREIRKEYARRMGWLSYDLESAQFAIIAKVWDVPVLTDFLKSGAKLWPYLAEKMEFENKELFKETVYKLAFGASMNRMTKDGPLRQWTELGLKNEYKQFLKIDVIQSLYEAREQRKDRIQLERQTTDAFGNTVLLAEIDGYTVETLLAMEIQSYEMKIMLSLAEYIMPIDRVDIALWIHDGIAVNHSLKESAWRKHEVGMMAAVARICSDEGILTSLSAE